MEKRILLAFILSIAVMFGFGLLRTPRTRPGSPSPAATAPTPTPAPAEPAKTAPVTPSTPAGSEGVTEDIHADQAEDVVVDTDLYTATLNNRGAVLKSFRLKKFTDTQGKPIELID